MKSANTSHATERSVLSHKDRPNARPWYQNESWFQTYLVGAAKAKRIKATPVLDKVLRKAFQRVYRAVAFDIDGTITAGSSSQVDAGLAAQIARMLKKGIPVILATGRGKTGVRAAAESIREACEDHVWYLRRLQCLCYNGTHRLYTKSSRPERFLECEELLVDVDIDTADVRRILVEGVRSYGAQLVEREKSFRLLCPSPSDATKLVHLVSRKIKGRRSWNVTHSTYEGRPVLEISPTTKNQGLHEIALRLGIPADRILRIGDQGQLLGNDHSLLNSDSGFCVGTPSRSKSGCIPVLDDEHAGVLVGHSAVAQLVRWVNIFPPLSLAKTNLRKRKEDLTGFEKLALRRSQEETRELSNAVSAKFRVMIPTGDRLSRSTSITATDLFDAKSGSVKLRPWEIEELECVHGDITRPFSIDKCSDYKKFCRVSDFATFSDTSLLLRGRAYYWSLAYPQQRRIRFFSAYLKPWRKFTEGIGKMALALEQSKVTLALYKLALAAFDNLRNLLVQTYYTLVVESDWTADSLPGESARKVHAVLVSLLRAYSRALLDLDYGWKPMLGDLRALSVEVLQIVKSSQKVKWTKLNAEIFKYRECDIFLQNLVATQIALRDFKRHGAFDGNRVCVVGLAYGGIELPAIAMAAAGPMELDIVTAIMKLSMYSSGANREEIFRAGEHYFQGLGRDVKFFPNEKEVSQFKEVMVENCLVADDNCTTCATLQLARDVLIKEGANVKGAVIVRFPSSNRLVHMGLPQHGFPDPENLLSFVRGLVGPSPYARLMVPSNIDDVYVNSLGLFDKSKHRMKDLLTAQRRVAME